MINKIRKLLVKVTALYIILSEIIFIPQTVHASYSYDSDYDYDDYDTDYDYDDYNYDDNDNSNNKTTTVTKTIKPKVTKKKIKKLCKELTDWTGYKVTYKLKKGKKYTYSMSPKIRREIIKQNSQYTNNCYYDTIKDRYNTNYYSWNQVSLQLFGKKTSNAQKAFAGDWGEEFPVLKIKVNKHKNNIYKVVSDIYFYNPEGKSKVGNMTIYLKKNRKSSYGVAITKIIIEKKK